MIMKKIIISCLFCFVSVYAFGQDYYRYLDKKKIRCEISTTKMLVKMEKHDVKNIKNTLQNTITGNIKEVLDLDFGLYLVEIDNTSKKNMLEFQRQWSSREDIIYVSPIFRDGRNEESFANQIIIRLKSKDDYPVLRKYADTYLIKDIRRLFEDDVLLFEGDELVYILTLPHNSKKDAMVIACELYETGLFQYVDPNFITIFPLATNDTYFSNQWGLKNTGQSGGTAGMDIKAEQAWTITTGSSSRKIAILDTGVDLNHPDLVSNLLNGYDATYHDPSHYNTTNTYGAPINSSGDFPHGTKCAGVVAAQGYNSKGIVGIAYNCKILPVTVGISSSIPSSTVLIGMRWAIKNGADVISMSFGCPQTAELNLMIDSAVTFGRNNKGCILVACAHNQNSTNVTYPASSDKVIAVGALLNDGTRKNDSNHGPNLNVMAPGEGIYSTCMLGTTENTVINNGANGVYTSDFSATSAATPHVAGVAALILSENSNLTAQEVRDIIDMTARKLDNYAFQTTSAHPNGSWNNYVGYGLVDAQAAVQAATCISSWTNPQITSNRFIRSCNNSFSLQNITVKNNAKLTVKTNVMSINGTFEVQSGSSFEIR
jgi:subtilisin family serine protease